jgi:RNA polymerase sigma-70 factor (ECF subfamily)
MPDRSEAMNDDDVVVACRDGDHEMFGILVRRYEKELMGHALALLGNREDALDVVQEVFVRAFKSLSKFEYGRNFYPWLYGIMRNLCVDRFRQTTRKEQREQTLWRPGEVC